MTDAEPVQGRRLAIVVAVGEYADPSLARLTAPAGDAAALREVLADPDIGGFEVTSVQDQDANPIRLALEEFLTDRSPSDLLLVYLSCHGLVDLRRRLYFAARDTLKHRLASSAVEAHWLLDQLEECRARRQVVILDCCFSGAFARGAKGNPDLALGERLLGQGRGRVVLTASRGTEYSFEGEALADEPQSSVFTSALVAGIRTGAADADGDGYISVDDAYAFAFDQVRAAGAHQTPQRWLYGAEGGIVLARTPRVAGDSHPARVASQARRTVADQAPLRPARRRLPSRRTALAATAVLVAVVAVAVAWVLLTVMRDSPPQDPGAASNLGATSGGVDMAGPWRIEVRNDRTGDDSGCRLTVTSRVSGRTYTWDKVYGTQAFQVAGHGRFRWSTDDAGCLVVTHAGAGTRGLPFGVPVTAGDSDAFAAKEPVSVEVTDFSGSPSCELVLVSVATGRPVAVGDATPTNNPVRLDPSGASPVYLADAECSLEVSLA